MQRLKEHKREASRKIMLETQLIEDTCCKKEEGNQLQLNTNIFL